MASVNVAAWLDGKDQELRTSPSEMPTAGEGEVVVRNRAIAINPVSWKIQDTGMIVEQWPCILDMDVAGEIHEVGPGVNGFKKGDHIVAWLKGPLGQNPRFGAYQLYSVADATTIAKLPESISFAEGCVLPVGFSTALVSLSSPQGQGFALPLPSLNPKPSGKTIVVWGASSSVGVMTLQLARLAGVKVVAVASPHNFELCISNGAVEVFDYRSNSIIDNVVAAVKNTGDEFVGILDCVSLPDQSLHLCIPVLEQLGGGELGILLPFVQPEVSEKIRVTHILGMGEITHQFWKDFITPALDQGKVKCLPEPLIVGEGLEALQKALNVNRKGVSGKKVVVTIP